VANLIAGSRSPDVDRMLIRYFGASGPRYSVYIALRLLIIAKGLESATIECENPGGWFYGTFCEGALAYVRPTPAFFGLGSIHLCQPGFHNLSEPQRVATLIHEGAHRYIGSDDEAYYTLGCAETGETRALSDRDKRDNADSYGCLVQSLA